MNSLQIFFERFAVLATALPQTLDELRGIEQKAAQRE